MGCTIFIHHWPSFRPQILLLGLQLIAWRSIHHPDWIRSSLQARIFCYLTSPPVFSNRMDFANSFLAKEKNDLENIIGFKWEKEKTSVTLIKRKHPLDPLFYCVCLFSVLSPRWAILLPWGAPSLSCCKQIGRDQAQKRGKHTTHFNAHLAVLLLLLHLGNTFFYFCPLSQLWHPCH